MTIIPISIEIEKRVKSVSDRLLGLLEQLEPHLKEVIIDRKKLNGLGKSQVQNLLRAVQSASGIPEIKLFIQYQMGRDTYGNGWSKSSQGKKFGERMLGVLDEIAKETEQLAPVEWEPESKSELSLKLAERFFVYLMWQFTYVETTTANTQRNSQSRDYGNKQNRNHGPRRDKR